MRFAKSPRVTPTPAANLIETDPSPSRSWLPGPLSAWMWPAFHPPSLSIRLPTARPEASVPIAPGLDGQPHRTAIQRELRIGHGFTNNAFPRDETGVCDSGSIHLLDDGCLDSIARGRRDAGPCAPWRNHLKSSRRDGVGKSNAYPTTGFDATRRQPGQPAGGKPWPVWC